MFACRRVLRAKKGHVVREETVPREWVKKIRAKAPDLVEPGKPAPKLVLSFGGAGFLTTYSLGVAHWLQTENKSLVNQSYMLGAGSGILPAIALCCGPQNVDIPKLKDFIIECSANFEMGQEESRRAMVQLGAEKFAPKEVDKLIAGRLAVAVGFSNRDPGYMKQGKNEIYYGNLVSTFEGYDDVVSLVTAAMCPNMNDMCTFRDADNVMRGTLFTMSSEADTYCRHVHVHGYAGTGNRHHARHNFYFGRHGFVVNTSANVLMQSWAAFMPSRGPRQTVVDTLNRSFEAGMVDARRYERWEEDPYHFAKPDRTANDDFTFRTLRASLLGKTRNERFEL